VTKLTTMYFSKSHGTKLNKVLGCIFLGYETVKSEHKFTAKPTLTYTLHPTATPLAFFDMFLPDPLFKLLSDLTIIYATQRQEAAGIEDRYWIKTTPDKVKIVLYI